MDALIGMDYHLDPADTSPKYRQIANVISVYLRASQVPDGTKLPNDRELAKRFNTAVMTMAKALNHLAARGLLQRRVGSGTYVCNVKKTSPLNRRIAIVCHGVIFMEGGFVTSLLTELYRQAPEYCFDFIQLQRSPEEYAKTFAEYDLAGMIVLSAEKEFLPQISQFAKKGMNILQVGFWHKDFKDVSVGTDHMEAAKAAVEYFYSHGHRKIGVITSAFSDGTVHHSNMERLNAYNAKMLELDLPVLPEWVIIENSNTLDLENKLLKLADTGKMPSAFLVLNLPMSTRIYHILQSMDLKIPQDISLLGFDESYLCEQLTPGFSTISQNMSELVKRVMRRMALEDNEPVPPIPYVLIERSSCR